MWDPLGMGLHDCFHLSAPGALAVAENDCNPSSVEMHLDVDAKHDASNSARFSYQALRICCGAEKILASLRRFWAVARERFHHLPRMRCPAGSWQSHDPEMFLVIAAFPAQRCEVG